jgi:hypothetical protein
VQKSRSVGDLIFACLLAASAVIINDLLGAADNFGFTFVLGMRDHSTGRAAASYWSENPREEVA